MVLNKKIRILLILTFYLLAHIYEALGKILVANVPLRLLIFVCFAVHVLILITLVYLE